MKVRKLFRNFAAVAVLASIASTAFAQRPNAPKQERLLNGLKVLISNDPAAPRATVKIRVHSGAAFDPQGREGTMALLAESFFPNDATREFFRDDLGGSLEVTANYDYIQIAASAKPDQFLTMLESLATAVSAPTIDKETTPKLVAKRLETLKVLESEPGYVADLAVSRQLFGTFPYGRPVLGNTESVSKINFADLLDARSRFLGADNATVSIGGNVDPTIAFRAARRYFGAWLKSDRIPPATFKQPDAPDTKLVTLSTGGSDSGHVRFAFRGVSRNDRLYPASEILAAVLESRLKQNLGELKADDVFVRNEAHVLPGTVVVGLRTNAAETASAKIVSLMLARPVTPEEFSRARSAVLETRGKIAADEFWLDADTFKQSSATDVQKAFDSVSIADVQLLAESFSKNPVVAVALARADKSASN